MKISRFIVMAVFGLGLISQSSFGEAEVEGCRNCHFRQHGEGLSCECKKDDGSYGESSYRYCPDGRYINNKGRLDCDPYLMKSIICGKKPLPEALKERCKKAGFKI